MNANAPHLHNEAVDQTIDRALSGLRNAQPRSGLNGRILASLEHRAAPEATNPGGLPFRIAKGWGIARGSARGSTPHVSHLALWTATAAAIIAVTSMTILHYRVERAKNTVILSEASRSDAQSKNPDAARTTSTAELFSTTNPARTSGQPRTLIALTPSNSRHPERSVAQRRTSVFEDVEKPHDIVTTAQDPDAQALADLHAPSHPAPPIPMTAQEKLFRRMAQFHNATQLAELDPIVRAKENADETTAFKAFFPDPPPLKQAGDTE